MKLRPELQPPRVPEERLAWLCAEIDRIEGLIGQGDGDEAAEAAVAAFNSDTGHAYTLHHFFEYWGACNVEEFALAAARPARPRVPDITRDELAELVRRVMDCAPDWEYYLRLLEVNVANPHMADLLFHPPAELRDATPEELVDAALAYRPIAP